MGSIYSTDVQQCGDHTLDLVERNYVKFHYIIWNSVQFKTNECFICEIFFISFHQIKMD